MKQLQHNPKDECLCHAAYMLACTSPLAACCHPESETQSFSCGPAVFSVFPGRNLPSWKHGGTQVKELFTCLVEQKTQLDCALVVRV